jgi:2',3'-cyclic-nucleotide 2'-phosphodiesterase/3'-nucleotidase
VAQATITIQLENEGERRRATVVEKVGEIVDITAQPVDDDFVAHFRPSIDAVEQFVEQRLGTFTEPMYARDAFFGSAPFTDIIHQLQLSLTKADISFTAPLTFNSEIKAGPIYMSDMFKLYKFENQVYTIMMTGSEIRRYLEMSYALWTNTMQTADDHIMLLAPKAPGDNQREGFKNYTFNFDSAAGIDYEVDVTKPEGQKVRILQMSDGRPFSDEQWYRVAVNSYRGNGGGELLSRGAGIPLDSIPRRIVSTSERDLRHYLTEHIRQVGNVVPKALGNWRFVPEEWTAPAIERDRKLLFHNR